MFALAFKTLFFVDYTSVQSSELHGYIKPRIHGSTNTQDCFTITLRISKIFLAFLGPLIMTDPHELGGWKGRWAVIEGAGAGVEGAKRG